MRGCLSNGCSANLRWACSYKVEGLKGFVHHMLCGSDCPLHVYHQLYRSTPPTFHAMADQPLRAVPLSEQV